MLCYLWSLLSCFLWIDLTKYWPPTSANWSFNTKSWFSLFENCSKNEAPIFQQNDGRKNAFIWFIKAFILEKKFLTDNQKLYFHRKWKFLLPTWRIFFSTFWGCILWRGRRRWGNDDDFDGDTGDNEYDSDKDNNCNDDNNNYNNNNNDDNDNDYINNNKDNDCDDEIDDDFS